jgi:hypothetical protein
MSCICRLRDAPLESMEIFDSALLSLNEAKETGSDLSVQIGKSYPAAVATQAQSSRYYLP